MLASLRKSTSLIPLVPRSKARGKIDRAWGVIDNG
jgi:hypothetical protein